MRSSATSPRIATTDHAPVGPASSIATGGAAAATRTTTRSATSATSSPGRQRDPIADQQAGTVARPGVHLSGARTKAHDQVAGCELAAIAGGRAHRVADQAQARRGRGGVGVDLERIAGRRDRAAAAPAAGVDRVDGEDDLGQAQPPARHAARRAPRG